MLYDPKLIEVPGELRENMQKAHTALVEKAGFINRLSKGEADLMASAKVLISKIEIERAKYAEVFSAIESGESELDDTAGDCRKRIRDLESQITDAKETASDFGMRIKAAKVEFQDLEREFKRARKRIVSCFRKPMPGSGDMPEARKPLDLDGEISISGFMLVYLAIYDGDASGAPFPQHGQVNPKRFFEIMSGFFQTPTFSEVKELRDWFEAMVWGGEDVPAPVKIPIDAPQSDPVNWDNFNFGVGTLG